MNKSYGGESLWKTEITANSKVRAPVAADDPERQQYIERRSELIEEYTKELSESGLSPKQATQKAWSGTMITLWCELGLCYYSCKRLMLNAIDCTGEQYLQELYELVEEIISLKGN